MPICASFPIPMKNSQIRKAEMLAFTGQYKEAAELLHTYKKTLTHSSPELLLIDVKLSRCYEHLDD